MALAAVPVVDPGRAVFRVPSSPFPGVRRRLATARWRRPGAMLGAIALTAAAIAVIVVTELPGSSQGASPRAHASGSTTVQRRNLVATDTESGTLSYANPQTVFNRLSGTITSLPKVGQVIEPGRTLYRVSGAPVVLFDGAVPAYRDLTSGVTDGEDVLQLNRDLRSLGFDPEHQLALNDTWQTATTTAVEEWQSAVGETETGTVALGQIVFLPGSQRITSIDTMLGSTGAASSSSGAGSATSAAFSLSGSDATSVPGTAAAPRAEFVSLASTSTSPPAPTDSSAQPPSGTQSTPSATTPAACAQPDPSAPTTTTTTPVPSCTTTTTTTTTPTTPTPAPTTTTPENEPKPTSQTGGKSSTRKPSEAAILLALLKAETLELKKSGSAAGGSSRSSATGSGTSAGASGVSGGGGGSRGGGGGGGGAAASGGTAATSGASGSTAGASSGGGSSSASGGSSGGAANVQGILQTTSNQLVVTVDLDATKQSEAVVGEPVTVELPNGDTVNAKITQVSPVAQSTASTASSGSSGSASSGGGGGSSSSTPSATIPVTIQITGRHPTSGLDQAAVSVNFEQQVENHVLSVPVTALLATAGGGYAIQEAAAPHTLIAVTPGLFAAGYVQISGAQIYPGLQVTDSQG